MKGATHGRSRQLWRTFSRDLWAFRRPMAAAYFFRLLAVVAGLLSPWPLKIIIDDALGKHSLPKWMRALGARHLSKPQLILVMAGVIVALAVIRGIVDALQSRTAARVRERLNVRIRDRMLAHLQTLPPTIRMAHRSGELVMRLVGDVDLFVRLQTRTLPNIIEYAVTGAATLVLMLSIQPLLAALSIALLPGLALLVRHYGRRLGAASREKRRREGEVAGLAQEIVRGLPVIQALGGEPHTRRRFELTNQSSLRAGVEETRVTAAMERSLRVAHGAATALVVGGGALLVLSGRLTIGGLTVMSAYLIQLLKPIEKLNDLAEATSKGFAGGERLLSLLTERPLVQDAPGAVDIGRTRGVIELRDVWFAYPARDGVRPRHVLSGLNARFRPGELAVLVGASGAGKSTLLSLLVRLFDPTSGTILLDGRPLPEMTLRSLRSQMAMMSQDTHLFAGTLRDSVVPNGVQVEENRLWEALALVALDGFVRALPDQLDTPLGEDGLNLSGGQRQRLSLARAFLLDRPILLLDEPLSHVDPESERVIVRALEKLRKGRTCLAITHRYSLVDHADAIYRLENGQLIPQSVVDLAGRAKESA